MRSEARLAADVGGENLLAVDSGVLLQSADGDLLLRNAGGGARRSEAG
ncbi:MAG: hypothetical protein ACQEUZ_04235 [Pseudomonadota bacterium]